MIEKYRRKPDKVEAVQWTGKNTEEVRFWLGRDLKSDNYKWNGEVESLTIDTGDGWVDAIPGDYILLRFDGHFTVMRNYEFERKYEKVMKGKGKGRR